MLCPMVRSGRRLLRAKQFVGMMLAVNSHGNDTPIDVRGMNDDFRSLRKFPLQYFVCRWSDEVFPTKQKKPLGVKSQATIIVAMGKHFFIA